MNIRRCRRATVINGLTTMITETLSSPGIESRHSMTRVFLKWGALAALVGAALYLILALYAQREFVFAMRCS